ncbi:MAG: uracil-DNA glycosylase [Bacteroidetes bacterium]|nr:uracil-DNA glycosylase [Bacteroidota bacterium]MCB0803942.1 uracil-DNA glycosylase [Flavobacteriales bacterium]NOG57420.1 uracil-DNA glycosylase [Bacteroidota bacterium]
MTTRHKPFQSQLNKLDTEWNNFFSNQKVSVLLSKVYQNLSQSDAIIYPESNAIFKCFEHCKFQNTRVVILGQDPYHGEDEANGLAFSVNEHVKIPPSLRNIYKELVDDLNINRNDNGDLSNWAKQGVLLLNTVLTVEKDKANSHRKIGWENVTDSVIQELSERIDYLVFILWGKMAEQKIKLIDTKKHHIIKSAHPSPLSVYRGFWGSKPFSKTNQLLIKHGQKPINWN